MAAGAVPPNARTFQQFHTAEPEHPCKWWRGTGRKQTTGGISVELELHTVETKVAWVFFFFGLVWFFNLFTIAIKTILFGIAPSISVLTEKDYNLMFAKLTKKELPFACVIQTPARHFFISDIFPLFLSPREPASPAEDPRLWWNCLRC